MKTSQPQWFEALGSAHQTALKLFCFPYAGGSAQVFRCWQRHFSPEVNLWLVHLPGRGRRIDEPPVKDLQELVHGLADAIIPLLSENFAFWGHSMGALISFELVRELRRRCRSLPGALFLSGRSAPQLRISDPHTFDLSEEELIAELKRMKGTPRELLEDPEVIKLFLPTIRGDFQIVETYAYQDEDPFACPIYAYGGLQDARVPAESVCAWQKQTLGKFTARMFPGDHFFIHSSTARVISVLRRDVESEFLSRIHKHAY